MNEIFIILVIILVILLCLLLVTARSDGNGAKNIAKLGGGKNIGKKKSVKIGGFDTPILQAFYNTLVPYGVENTSGRVKTRITDLTQELDTLINTILIEKIKNNETADIDLDNQVLWLDTLLTKSTNLKTRLDKEGIFEAYKEKLYILQIINDLNKNYTQNDTQNDTQYNPEFLTNLQALSSSYTSWKYFQNLTITDQNNTDLDLYLLESQKELSGIYQLILNKNTQNINIYIEGTHVVQNQGLYTNLNKLLDDKSVSFSFATVTYEPDTIHENMIKTLRQIIEIKELLTKFSTELTTNKQLKTFLKELAELHEPGIETKTIKIQELNDLTTRLQYENIELQKRIESHQKEIEEQKLAYSEQNSMNSDFISRLDILTQEKKQNQAQIKSLNKQISLITEQIEIKNSMNSGLTSQLETFKQEQEKLETKLELLNQDHEIILNAKTAINNNLNEELKEHKLQIAACKIQVLTMRISNKKEKEENIKLKLKILNLEKSTETQATLLDSLNNKIASQDAELASQVAELKTKDTELASQAAELKTKYSQLTTKDSEISRQNNELATKTTKISDLGDEITELHYYNDDLQELLKQEKITPDFSVAKIELSPFQHFELFLKGVGEAEVVENLKKSPIAINGSAGTERVQNSNKVYFNPSSLKTINSLKKLFTSYPIINLQEFISKSKIPNGLWFRVGESMVI